MTALTVRPASTPPKADGTGRPDVSVKRTPSPPASQAGDVEIIQPYDQFMNRRVEPRFDCSGQSCLLVLSDRETVACQIVNQSASGAQVLFDTIGEVPAELWLIDPATNSLKRGRAAWFTPHKMGLKFNLIQTVTSRQTRPAKVPEYVYRLWLSHTATPPESADTTVYLD